MLFPDLSKMDEISKKTEEELNKLTAEQLEERLWSSLRLASKAPKGSSHQHLDELLRDTKE